MPLCHTVGINNSSNAFTVRYAFLDKEDASNYMQIISDFKKLYGERLCPSVILTDREEALIEVIEYHFASI